MLASFKPDLLKKISHLFSSCDAPHSNPLLILLFDLDKYHGVLHSHFVYKYLVLSINKSVLNLTLSVHFTKPIVPKNAKTLCLKYC